MVLAIEGVAGVTREIDVPRCISGSAVSELTLVRSPLGQPQLVSRRVILADEHVVPSGVAAGHGALGRSCDDAVAELVCRHRVAKLIAAAARQPGPDLGVNSVSADDQESPNE